MVLVLSNDDAERVLTMTGTVAALEQLYGDLGRGSAVYRGRTDLLTPTTSSAGIDVPSAHQLKSLEGAVPRLAAASTRITSDVVAFPTVNGQLRRVKIPAAAGDRYLGIILLFSTATGELIAILQDGILQRLAVGAVNAIAAKSLAREDATTVGLLGAGAQAGPQLLGLGEVRKLTRAAVYDPAPGVADAFAKRMAPLLGFDVVAVESAEAALRDVDIAVTSTNSRVPFFPASWLRKGMHLSCMQRDEPEDDCFDAADIVVFHTRAKEHEYASTDFEEIERRHNFVMHDHPPRELDWNRFPDLGELVSGKVAGRSHDDQRTLFLNSTGVGAVYTTIGHLVYTKALENGLGHSIPIDWFLETTH
jgi:alanine dehydrogenase